MLPLRKIRKIKTKFFGRTWGKIRKIKRTEVNFCVLVLVDEITSSPSLLILFFSCSEAGRNIHVKGETEAGSNIMMTDL